MRFLKIVAPEVTDAGKMLGNPLIGKGLSVLDGLATIYGISEEGISVIATLDLVADVITFVVPKAGLPIMVGKELLSDTYIVATESFPAVSAGLNNVATESTSSYAHWMRYH